MGTRALLWCYLNSKLAQEEVISGEGSEVKDTTTAASLLERELIDCTTAKTPKVDGLYSIVSKYDVGEVWFFFKRPVVDLNYSSIVFTWVKETFNPPYYSVRYNKFEPGAQEALPLNWRPVPSSPTSKEIKEVKDLVTRILSNITRSRPAPGV